MSTTANFQWSRFAAAVTLAVAAASCGVTAPAAADPGYCAEHPEDTSAICDLIRNPPTTATTSPKGGLDNAIDTIGHGAMVVGVVLVAILVAGWILASIFGTGDQEQRGREIAADHHEQQVLAAHAEAAANAPDPADYDPLGIGVAPPPAPEVKVPPLPNLSPEDAQRFAKFGRVVELIPGSATAALVAPNGNWKKAEDAFTAACRAANFGRVEDRRIAPGIDRTRSVFTPAATLVRVEPQDSGDAVIVVRTADLSVGETELETVTPFLLRTARVRLAGKWVRAYSSDEFTLTLTTRSNNEITAAAAQAQAPVAAEEDPWS